MTVILFIAVVALGVVLGGLVSRVRQLDSRVSDLQDRLIRLDPGMATERHPRRDDDPTPERAMP